VGNPAKILVIDDELAIRKFLAASVDESLYTMVEAADGLTGVRLAATESPNVILLDLGLPDIDGIEVTRRIREWSQVPIIVVSARGEERAKVAALDAGANDYLTKPFGLPELFARVRVALRYSNAEATSSTVTVEGLEIDFAARIVKKNGQEVHLTPTEFKLLGLLARNLGKVLTHRQLLVEVWGPEYADELHYLRVYAQQLRGKIEDEPTQPRLLVTETGVGYRLRGE
jgi:two-component system KDP operon response regulator KdpE